MLTRAILALFAVLGTSHSAIAVDYAQGRPITQVIDRSIRDCRSSGELQVPLITWGADLVTIHANGNREKTAPGSRFADEGLKLRLVREDNFARQVEAYLQCKSPFLRATVGMASMIVDVTEADPRTQMVAIYQHSWSNGGDAMVVRQGIAKPADLAGRTIALQSYGPHVDYLVTLLRDASVPLSRVKFKWTHDLVGFDGSTPAAALHSDAGIDAAMVIIPDALALTSDGTVGTGSENSVKGAKILLSTRSASRVIADVYLVRRDFFDANRDKVQSFVHALMKAEEEVRRTIREGGGRETKLMKAGARILLDAAEAVEDARALWADAESVGWRGNVAFFANAASPRRYERLTEDAQISLVKLGLVTKAHKLAKANWDFARLSDGLSDTAGVELPRFDQAAVNRIVTQRQAQGTIDDGTLFAFEVHFQPNQNSFPADLYRDQFTRVIDLASTYAGAVISVEGHADPLGYLRKKKGRAPQSVLVEMAQSARNLSLTRANAVRDSLIQMAGDQGIQLDPSQFATVGMGYLDPRTGICGQDPCAPKTENEWRSNMRVAFKIIQVEAEANVFTPLN